METPGIRETAAVSVEAQGQPTLTCQPLAPWPVLLLLALTILFVAARSYARSTRPLSFLRRLVLYTLRVLAALVIVLCLSGPVWVRELVLREKGLCFIALDSSSSMNLRDAPQGLSRWEFAGRFFSEHQGQLAQLGRRYEIRRLLFDAVPRETARLPGEEATREAPRPEGRATDLAAVLERLASEAAGTPAAGVFLLTDGRHNTPKDPLAPARLLRAAGAPLFIVGVGQEATPADYTEIAVKLLEVPERAFVQSSVTMRIEVESQIPRATQVPLTVTVNGEKIKEEFLNLPAGRDLVSVEVTYRPARLGLHRVVASLPALPQEANVNNNTKTAYFRVAKSKLAVWYIEGAVRKEFGSLRGALETAPNMSLHARNAFARRGMMEPDLLPAAEEAWRDQRLIILGDLPAKRFAPEQLTRLAKFVEDGGAVLMLGGVENFGPGGWHETPLGPVLPVEMGWTDGAARGPLPLVVTGEGANHPALKLSTDPVQDKALWGLLPALPGVSAVRAVKPAAKVLLRAGPHPLLVVQEYGKGRAAVFTGDTTWQWILKAGQPEAHKFFWRNLATWLTHSDYRDPEQVVFVDTDRLLYLLGDEVVLNTTVQATEALKGRIESARVVASLEPDGAAKETWELGTGPREYPDKRKPQRPGTYHFRAEALDAAGQVLGKDEVSFEVEVLDVENANPKAHPGLLRRLAILSGGDFFDAEHAREALQALLHRPPGFTKTVRDPEPVWNHWGFFALFVALVTLEWMLRKYWGLV